MQARSELGASVHNESNAGRSSPGAGSFKSKKPLAVIATPDLDLWAQLGPMLESTVALRHADSLATAANVSYGIGALALTTGAVLYFTGSRQASDEPSTGLRVSPRLATTSQGLLLEGSF